MEVQWAPLLTETRKQQAERPRLPSAGSVWQHPLEYAAVPFVCYILHSGAATGARYGNRARMTTTLGEFFVCLFLVAIINEKLEHVSLNKATVHNNCLCGFIRVTHGFYGTARVWDI